VEVGIGYPGMFPGIDRDLVLNWATHAEDAGFASLSTGERLSFGNPDLLVTMAMAGAVTSRIRLMSTVMVLPLHSPGVIAKQAATMDVMTRGRFVLGVGVGPRADDYEVVPVPFEQRGECFDEQLALFKRMWSNQPREGETWVGPQPHTVGGPKVLIGPGSVRAARRTGLVDGMATFGGTPDPAGHVKLYEAGLESWKDAGRSGKPYFAAGLYFALGPSSGEKAHAYLRQYYEYLPDADLWSMIDRLETTTEQSVRDTLTRFEDAGVDEFYLCPLIAEIDQIKLLADIAEPYLTPQNTNRGENVVR
jgi:alkanesulfonate monooxygenase SsuD/methylene tetrahydromethanopterin reductase-like flavin-dependent oxidoreductase (luciferase family)